MSSKFYRHRYGGIYQHIYSGKSTVDASDVEVYMHLWPFEHSIWVRPSDQFWDGRFAEISFNEVTAARSGDRAADQAAVNATRAELKKPS